MLIDVSKFCYFNNFSRFEILILFLLQIVGHFATRLGHWRDLNITDGFDKFVREIHKLSSKLVFVLNNK